jgi:hypothetical protein
MTLKVKKKKITVLEIAELNDKFYILHALGSNKYYF